MKFGEIPPVVKEIVFKEIVDRHQTDGLTDGHYKFMGLTLQANFNSITPYCTNPNLTKHSCTDCQPHNVLCACTD